MTTEEKNIEIAKILTDRKFYEDEELSFDSDANWQFEAIQWLNKQGYFFESTSEPDNSAFARISTWGEDYLETVVHTHGSKLGMINAVFEALYQFSQYIKNKV